MVQGKVVSKTSNGFFSTFNLKLAFDLTKTPSRIKKVSRKVEILELLIFSQLSIILLSKESQSFSSNASMDRLTST
jgi:hypothetical protein